MSNRPARPWHRAFVTVLITVSTAAMAAEPPALNYVNLDAPFAFDVVKQKHPEHLAKIRTILTEVPDQPFETMSNWLRTRFEATGIHFSGLLLTSEPPQGFLSFRLGDTEYQTRVTFGHPPRKPIPIKRREGPTVYDMWPQLGNP